MSDFHVNRIRRLFGERFGLDTRHIVVRSPGRINMIGEHTDYNEGFVLPAAIDKTIIFVLSPRSDGVIRMVAADLNDELEVRLCELKRSPKQWANYLLGVADQLKNAGYHFEGINVVFGGDVPVGAGLSSSAALEAGFMFSLNETFSFGIDKLHMVKMAQKAEHEYAGVKCGIMDQFINIFGRDKTVLKIDCRTLEHEHFPFERNDLRIVLCETPTQHSLASSEYNIRRRECENGVMILNQYDAAIKSLRDLSMEFLLEHQGDLTPVVFKRCRYVVEENARVLKSCEDLKKNDMTSFGRNMFESHSGLRDDYEVSSRELDILVDMAAGFEGVLGSRMMGAGFGGCTINIIEDSKADFFVEHIHNRFMELTGKEIKLHATKIKGGTERID